MSRLLIFGSGGLGREMAWHLEMQSPGASLPPLGGFVDDDPTTWGKEVYGAPVLGRLEDIASTDDQVLLGVGSPRTRGRAIARIQAVGAALYTLISHDVVSSRTAIVDQGATIESGVVLGPDASVGRGVLINKRVMVTHDASVGSCSVVSPYTFLGGYSRVGRGCDLGAHVTLVPKVVVGEGCVIGAGAVVTTDIPPFKLAVGVPAKVVRSLPEWDTHVIESVGDVASQK